MLWGRTAARLGLLTRGSITSPGWARSMTRATRPVAPINNHTCCALRSASSATSTAPKAACLIIGNEVLSGKITDSNTASLAKLLYARGVDMVRVEMIPDVKEDIVASVRGLSERVGSDGFVFTSGGIGPTHDDITYESIAEAFGRTLVEDALTVSKMTAHYTKQGKEVNAARMRMAILPSDCEILETPGLWVPMVRVENVYILPGIPRLFEAMVGANKDRFQGPSIVLTTLFTQQGEGDIGEALRQIATAHPGVQIGSYPRTTDEQNYTTKLCFEGRDEADVAAAVQAARAAFELYEES